MEINIACMCNSLPKTVSGGSFHDWEKGQGIPGSLSNSTRGFSSLEISVECHHLVFVSHNFLSWSSPYWLEFKKPVPFPESPISVARSKNSGLIYTKMTQWATAWAKLKGTRCCRVWSFRWMDSSIYTEKVKAPGATWLSSLDLEHARGNPQLPFRPAAHAGHFLTWNFLGNLSCISPPN